MQGKVTVISGSGSGHEPLNTGYVGRGMLDAVAVGEVFTSPPVPTILECIKAAEGGKGAMLLLGNYAGDVMNFDMAVELAQDEGIEARKVRCPGPLARQDRLRRIVGEVQLPQLAVTCGQIPQQDAARLLTRRDHELQSVPVPGREALDTGRAGTGAVLAHHHGVPTSGDLRAALQ